MIILTVAKDRICLFVWKKEKLFRASLNSNSVIDTKDAQVLLVAKKMKFTLKNWFK